MRKPAISVLIDTYNHACFIEQALHSVLGQRGIDHAAIETIVVDDGSSDETPEILGRYAGRIRIHRKPNGGQASSFNEGLRLCSGDIVAFLDADDWWHADKLARVVAAFDDHPEICAVGHGIVIADEVAGRHEQLSPGSLLTLRHDRRDTVGLFHQSKCYLGTSRLTARRDVLMKLLPVPAPLVFEADEHFFTLLPACGPVLVLPDFLTFYRLHGGNLFQDSKTMEGKIGITADPRLNKRARVFECLAETLPGSLRELGVEPDVVDDLMEPVRLSANRLRFTVSGGSRWQNFCSEYQAIRSRAAREKTGSFIVAGGTLALAALLPPKTF